VDAGSADQTVPLTVPGRGPAGYRGPSGGPRPGGGGDPGWSAAPRRTPVRRRWLRRVCWSLGTLIALGVAAFAVLLAVTPSVGSAMSVARAQAREHHSPYPGPAVPFRFTKALTSTEDHRFGSVLEPGFDPFAVGRVIASGLTGGGDQGGATLYQQLAKVLYAPQVSGLRLYAYEVALGIKLKFSYSDAQILRMYAGVVYYGHGYYGLQDASCGYFGRQPGQLSWPQAAVLAGLVQAPTDYDPLKHPKLARSRESHVLARLVATGVLSQRQASAAFAVPMSRLLADAGGCPA
jgi:membrane peptidoglycan carboxypeptidase